MSDEPKFLDVDDETPQPLPVDLDFYETAEEHERQKDALIEHADAINDLR